MPTPEATAGRPKQARGWRGGGMGKGIAAGTRQCYFSGRQQMLNRCRMYRAGDVQRVKAGHTGPPVPVTHTLFLNVCRSIAECAMCRHSLTHSLTYSLSH